MKSTSLWERHLKNKDILIAFLSAIIERIQSSAAACQTDIMLIAEILTKKENSKLLNHCSRKILGTYNVLKVRNCFKILFRLKNFAQFSYRRFEY